MVIEAKEQTLRASIRNSILHNPNRTYDLVRQRCTYQETIEISTGGTPLGGVLAEDYEIPSDSDQRAYPRKISVWTEAIWTGVRIMEQLRREGKIIDYDCRYVKVGLDKQPRIALFTLGTPLVESTRSRYRELLATPPLRKL